MKKRISICVALLFCIMLSATSIITFATNDLQKCSDLIINEILINENLKRIEIKNVNYLQRSALSYDDEKILRELQAEYSLDDLTIKSNKIIIQIEKVYPTEYDSDKCSS